VFEFMKASSLYQKIISTTPTTMSSSKDTAQKQWELENKIKEVSDEQLYKFDEEKENKIRQERPWEKE